MERGGKFCTGAPILLVEGLRISHYCGVKKKNFNYVFKTIETTPTKCTSLVLFTRLIYATLLRDGDLNFTILAFLGAKGLFLIVFIGRK